MGESSTVRTWLPAIAMLAASVAAAGWLEFRPVDDRFVAAVFPPWWGAVRSTDAVVAAGGAVLGWGGMSSIVITRSDGDDFIVRLHQAGALVLLEPARFGLCAGADPAVGESVREGNRT